MILHSIEARINLYRLESTVDFTKSPHERIEAVCKRAYEDIDKSNDFHIPKCDRTPIDPSSIRIPEDRTHTEKYRKIRRAYHERTYIPRGNKQAKHAINGDR